MFSCFKDKDFLIRFLKISLPVMVSAFITFLVTFIDNIMVGSVSNETVSGVYAANEVTFIFELGAFGILEGAGIFIQQFNGAKDEEHMKQCFRYKIGAGILYLIIAIPIVFIFGKYLIALYCQKDSSSNIILSEGIKYLNIIAISYIPYTIGTFYSSSLREIGKTKYAMYASLSAIACNVIFNFIFIILLSWGGQGAALATLVARVVEMIVLILISHHKKMPFCFKAYKGFHIDKDLINSINKKTFLFFINEIGWSVGIMLQSLAFSQRDGVLASISVVTTVSNIIQILINGLSIGIGVMVGSSLGAQEYSKAKYEAKNLNFLGFYSAISIGLILIILSPFIPHLFNKIDPLQKELATKLIIIYGSLLFARIIATSVYFIMKAGGKSFITFIFDTGLMIVLYVPVAWILSYFTTLDLLYIYLIVNSIDIIKMIIGLILFKKISWAENLTLPIG